MIQEPSSRHLFNSFSHKEPILIYGCEGLELVLNPITKDYLNISSHYLVKESNVMFSKATLKQNEILKFINHVKKKLEDELMESNLTSGIASAAVFSPHLHLPFAQLETEILLFTDLKSGLEEYEISISTEGNFYSKEINHTKDLVNFAEKVHFPTQGITLKVIENDTVIKTIFNIITWDFLYSAGLTLNKYGQQLIAETDIRPHLNPTRFKLIERTAKNLFSRLSKEKSQIA